MPTYDYICENCKTTFSISTSFSSSISCEIACPCCHEENIHRLYSVPNVIFKGSGFHTTDNRKTTEEKD